MATLFGVPLGPQQGRRQADRLVRNLEAKLRRLDAKIISASRGLRRLRRSDLPRKIVREVEKQIAREGWMERIILDRFKSEARQGPGSAKWKILNAMYARRKARLGFGRKINVRTGRLRQAILRHVRGKFDYLNATAKWKPNQAHTQYSKFVELVRPILRPPSKKELRPVIVRANEIAADLLAKEAA